MNIAARKKILGIRGMAAVRAGLKPTQAEAAQIGWVEELRARNPAMGGDIAKQVQAKAREMLKPQKSTSAARSSGLVKKKISYDLKSKTINYGGVVYSPDGKKSYVLKGKTINYPGEKTDSNTIQRKTSSQTPSSLTNRQTKEINKEIPKQQFSIIRKATHTIIGKETIQSIKDQGIKKTITKIPSKIKREVDIAGGKKAYAKQVGSSLLDFSRSVQRGSLKTMSDVPRIISEPISSFIQGKGFKKSIGESKPYIKNILANPDVRVVGGLTLFSLGSQVIPKATSKVFAAWTGASAVKTAISPTPQNVAETSILAAGSISPIIGKRLPKIRVISEKIPYGEGAKKTVIKRTLVDVGEVTQDVGRTFTYKNPSREVYFTLRQKGIKTDSAWDGRGSSGLIIKTGSGRIPKRSKALIEMGNILSGKKVLPKPKTTYQTEQPFKVEFIKTEPKLEGYKEVKSNNLILLTKQKPPKLKEIQLRKKFRSLDNPFVGMNFGGNIQTLSGERLDLSKGLFMDLYKKKKRLAYYYEYGEPIIVTMNEAKRGYTTQQNTMLSSQNITGLKSINIISSNKLHQTERLKTLTEAAKEKLTILKSKKTSTRFIGGPSRFIGGPSKVKAEEVKNLLRLVKTPSSVGSDVRTSLLRLNKLGTSQKTTPTQANILLSGSVSLSDQVSSSDQVSLLKSITVQKQRLKQKTEQRLQTDMFLLKKTPTADKDMITSLKQPKQSYEVMVKRKLLKKGLKQYKSRGYKSAGKGLTRKAAMGLGMSITDNYTNRSFKIRPVGGKPKKNYGLERKHEVLKRKFRYAKKNPKVFVEKTTYAIDQSPEKRGIPFEAARLRKAGIIKSRTNIMKKKKTKSKKTRWV